MRPVGVVVLAVNPGRQAAGYELPDSDRPMRDDEPECDPPWAASG